MRNRTSQSGTPTDRVCTRTHRRSRAVCFRDCSRPRSAWSERTLSVPGSQYPFCSSGEIAWWRGRDCCRAVAGAGCGRYRGGPYGHRGRTSFGHAENREENLGSSTWLRVSRRGQQNADRLAFTPTHRRLLNRCFRDYSRPLWSAMNVHPACQDVNTLLGFFRKLPPAGRRTVYGPRAAGVLPARRAP